MVLIMEIKHQEIFYAMLDDIGGVDYFHRHAILINGEWSTYMTVRGEVVKVCFTIDEDRLEVVGGGPDGVGFGLTAESAVSNLAQWYEDCANRMSGVARNNCVIAEMLRFASKKLGDSTR
jgi:hypothetical protein